MLCEVRIGFDNLDVVLNYFLYWNMYALNSVEAEAVGEEEEEEEEENIMQI